MRVACEEALGWPPEMIDDYEEASRVRQVFKGRGMPAHLMSILEPGPGGEAP